jgi:hypothetical protein
VVALNNSGIGSGDGNKAIQIDVRDELSIFRGNEQ